MIMWVVSTQAAGLAVDALMVRPYGTTTRFAGVEGTGARVTILPEFRTNHSKKEKNVLQCIEVPYRNHSN